MTSSNIASRTDNLESMQGMKSTMAVTATVDNKRRSVILISGNSYDYEDEESNDPVKYIDINSLPTSVRDQLKVLDLDGDGKIDTAEMLGAANTQGTLKGQNSLLRKGALFVSALSVALVCVLGGTVYGIVKLSKDTQVEGRALMNMNGMPIGTNANKVSVPFGALSYMPGKTVANVDELSLSSVEGVNYYFKTESVMVIPEKSVVLKTASGDVITWDTSLDKGAEIHVVLKDGTTWESPACCSTCSMTSVVADEHVESALEDFENAHAAIKEDVARRIKEISQKPSNKDDFLDNCKGVCSSCYSYC
ncbi:hypothetical protein ACHAWF_005130 [Thalassiosira exigua]